MVGSGLLISNRSALNSYVPLDMVILRIVPTFAAYGQSGHNERYVEFGNSFFRPP